MEIIIWSGSLDDDKKTTFPTAVKMSNKVRKCTGCGTTSTPLWRRNNLGEVVCNACGNFLLISGLYLKSNQQKRPKYLRKDYSEPQERSFQFHWSHPTVQPERQSTPSNKCYNCNTTDTPLWRRDLEGNSICNACGLYYKLHGSHRPKEMKTPIIRRRKRAHMARSDSFYTDSLVLPPIKMQVMNDGKLPPLQQLCHAATYSPLSPEMVKEEPARLIKHDYLPSPKMSPLEVQKKESLMYLAEIATSKSSSSIMSLSNILS
ncbi:hypothetical protein HK103_006910 [Boothiomyces macroporosus]|uniref:GATA-type domain-containing protein n=1 Tax=Boothiomyces macroporosus TaxID=261099 RepID=A0AAD5UKX1_9FUNG|nr:hypothetical protein HK103_006910 [Boothiomyces macroporosus]